MCATLLETSIFFMNSKESKYLDQGKKTILLYSFLTLFTLLSTPSIITGQQLAEESTDSIQIEWLDAVKKSKNLEPFYIENSGILLNNTVYIGLEEINKQLLDLKRNAGQLSNYKKLEVHQLRDNQKFELGVYSTESGNIFTTIIGWKLGTKWAKEFEVIYKNGKDFTLEEESIIDGRGKWEELANQHRPDLIVDEVFSDNGKYFHRGTQYKNIEIIKAYSYMNNDSYKITLEALKVLQVNNKVIFEIGIYRAGGEGLYTLIWVKENEEWNLLLDFNF